MSIIVRRLAAGRVSRRIGLGQAQHVDTLVNNENSERRCDTGKGVDKESNDLFRRESIIEVRSRVKWKQRKK